ncbi:hypothetical protein ACFVYP_07005 [Kitasatospora sp. NPDC058201]|uniref:phage terminase small subunit n=1 Tax=unclassified Kitasatospora TaxID=2633591 RepID=UPI0036662D63
MPQLPKSPATRQRRNRASTARLLAELPEGFVAPELPEARPWHAMTLAWWEDVWASPMAGEFIGGGADIHGLFLLAILVDDFWQSPTTSLASEIRLQRQCFGLTPIDRRRLQWEIDRGEDASERTRRRRVPPPAADAAPEGQPVDPRSILYAV